MGYYGDIQNSQFGSSMIWQLGEFKGKLRYMKYDGTYDPIIIDTPTPSSSPSMLPSSTPSSSNSGFCLDSTLALATGTTTAYCSLFDQPEFNVYCTTEAVASHCPLTCDQCDTLGCTDSSGGYMYQDNGPLYCSMFD